MTEAFSKTPGYKLIIIGDGPEKEGLQKKYDKENIKFLGATDRESILMYMKKARALIFPSVWYEGLPYTILEAFATGTPVIASFLGSMKEMITHGYNGYHFIPGNHEDLIEKLHLFSRKDTSTLYQNARATYIQNYTPETHYNRLLKLYSYERSNNQA